VHVPDGLMDPVVALVGTVEFLIVIAAVLLVSSKRMKEQNLPRIAVLCAGIFVAQMLNFPIGGGTTGHLIGAALLAILAGPLMAIIGMTVVLIIQALMFGDGGITAFGINATNMAIIAPLAGWGVYTLIKPMCDRTGRSGEGIAVAIAAWSSVFIASAACAAQLAVSYAISDGAYGIVGSVSIPAMLGYHAVIGVGEAIISVGVVAYLTTVSPRAFSVPEPGPAGKGLVSRITSSKLALASLSILLVFALALPLYFLYSSEGEDGLERTMSDAGVGEQEQLLSAPFSYGDEYFAALFAGLLGFLVVALLALGLMKILARKTPES
jgi:cobalt/nickel transport system permease protein